jgi:hypothetical protein
VLINLGEFAFEANNLHSLGLKKNKDGDLVLEICLLSPGGLERVNVANDDDEGTIFFYQKILEACNMTGKVMSVVRQRKPYGEINSKPREQQSNIPHFNELETKSHLNGQPEPSAQVHQGAEDVKSQS